MAATVAEPAVSGAGAPASAAAPTADWIQTRSPEVILFTSFDGRGSGSTIGPDGRSTSLMAMLVGCDASIVAPAR
jgi:hypothetical protein